MTQWRLFPEGTVPECVTREWHRPRERAPHLEQFGPQRNRLLAAANHVLRARDERGIGSVVDLGAGDGGLLSLLPRDLPAWGYDLCPANVWAAVQERHVDVRYADLMDAAIEWADLAACTEVLEHLADPHAFVRRVAEQCRVIVASSPATETDLQHYEFHTWAFDEEGYRELLEQAGYRVLRYERVDWFQVVTACV